jgi:hypothetical protein
VDGALSIIRGAGDATPIQRRFYCATLAESEEEAVLIAMEQVKTDQAAYVEVEELDIINEETEE